MYKIKIYAGKDPIGRIMLDSGAEKPAEFKTAHQAKKAAKKYKANSNLGMWCEIVMS